MLRPFSLRWLVPFALVVLLVPACSDSTDEAADTTLAPTTTTEVAATTTKAPTTSTATAPGDPGLDVEFEAVLTDSACTLTGPSDVAPGDHWILFTNNSGTDDIELAVRQITPGHTYADIVAEQEELGAVFARPLWITDGVISFAKPPDVPLAENESLWAWTLTPGTYFARTYTLSKAPDGRKYFWFCGPITVTEP
jgi:hypothetical protein